MKWKRATKDYVEDRRGQGGGALGGGGGFGGGGGGGGGRGGGLPIPIPGGKGGSIGGLGIVILIAFVALQMCGGGLGGGGTSAPGGGGPGPAATGTVRNPGTGSIPPEEEMIEFVRSVTDDVQTTWVEAFRADGRQYEETTLVVFEEGVETACGAASAQSGPFYCPADKKVYLDLTFFNDLASQFGAPGDFAIAYVIAHEFGHHVQTILGISESVRGQQQSNPDKANDLSVRMELQADCFAGVWAYSVKTKPDDHAVQEITDEDIREGLVAAAAVGDDRIQQQSGQGVDPDSFTHGTSEQRQEWFTRGFTEGSADACDTFNS